MVDRVHVHERAQKTRYCPDDVPSVSGLDVAPCRREAEWRRIKKSSHEVLCGIEVRDRGLDQLAVLAALAFEFGLPSTREALNVRVQKLEGPSDRRAKDRAEYEAHRQGS